VLCGMGLLCGEVVFLLVVIFGGVGVWDDGVRGPGLGQAARAPGCLLVIAYQKSYIH